jgi:type 1 glutamine amidotransferase
MIRQLAALAAFAASCGFAAGGKLSAVVIDGVNNHDWAAGTAAIRTILEGTGRFTVDVSTYPQLPDFRRYDVVIDNFNGGDGPTGTRWPAEAERALEAYVRNGGGLVVFHAANNAFLNWPEYNQMIGLGWRVPSFGPGIAIGPGGAIQRIPQGQGRPPGHGPRHDFELFVLDRQHPITQGLPAHWLHPSEQLTHGQHGPAEGLTILTYAFSEISQQGEPMDWVRQFGKGRVYTTMLGHTWKDELNPNLDDVNFQALLARGCEWAATGAVTLPADLGWKPLFNGKNRDGWEARGTALWTVMDDGVLFAQRAQGPAWLYTTKAFADYDLHLEYWLAPGGADGVSLRDGGHEIPLPGRGVQWNSMEVESRSGALRVRINGTPAGDYPGDAAGAKAGPIGLGLHDPFSTVMVRNIRIRSLTVAGR